MTQIKCELIAITENLAKDGGLDKLDKQCQKTAQISSKATEKCGSSWLGPVNNKWKGDKVISNRHLYQKIEVLRKTETLVLQKLPLRLCWKKSNGKNTVWYLT